MDTEDNAAARLDLLAKHFREHPVTGPSLRSAPQTTPSAPVNLDTVDHITASVREIADYTRSVNTAATPLPADVAAVYAWCVENTEHAEATHRRQRDVIVHRQYLEHALRTGDTSVIPPHRCPACRTFGLMVRFGRVVCTNKRCLDDDGMTRTWSLGRLAHEYVKTENVRNVSAT